jgi:hypothetical protein
VRYKGIILAIGIVAVIRLVAWLWPESPLPTTIPAQPESPEPALIQPELHGALQSHLEASEHFVLLSLDPEDTDAHRQAIKDLGLKRKPPTRRPERFYEYGVLGKTELRDAQLRTQLVAAIAEGIRANTSGLSASCFEPRHGIRAVRGTQAVDLVICFHCYSLSIHGPIETGYPIFRHAQPIMDRALRQAHVPQVQPH